MRRIISTLAIVLASFTASHAEAQTRTLTISSTEYPPFYGSTLENNGFMTEIVVEAFSRGGYEIEVSFLPWKRAFDGTKAGRVDALFTMWFREEREEWFAFSDGLPANEIGFFQLSDAPVEFTALADLDAQTIGVVRGYAPPPVFESANLSISLAADEEENLRKLLHGRIELALVDRIVASHIVSSTLSSGKDKLEWEGTVIDSETQHLVVSRQADDHEAILAAFNLGPSEMKAEGRVTAIITSYGLCIGDPREC